MGNTKNYTPFFPDSVFRWVIYITIGVVAVAIALVIHELGHAVSAHLLGWEVIEMHLWGFSILPEFSYAGFSDGYIGYTAWSALETPTTFERAFVLIMGSGATLLVSVISISALYLLKPISFFVRTVLFFLSLLYLDMVTYTFGLRPSGDSEPLEAARLFGISDTLWITFVILLLLLMTTAVVLYFFIFQRTQIEKGVS